MHQWSQVLQLRLKLSNLGFFKKQRTTIISSMFGGNDHYVINPYNCLQACDSLRVYMNILEFTQKQILYVN